MKILKYNFKNTILNRAFKGYTSDNPPSTLNIGSPFAEGEYSEIYELDNVTASYSPGVDTEYYHFHRFEFKINETANAIVELRIFYRGYGYFEDRGSSGVDLYIWNHRLNRWELIGYHLYDELHDLEAVIRGNIGDYLGDGNHLNLLAITHSMGTSCPFYYSYNGLNYTFDGEGLVSAMLPWFEGSSTVRLEHLKSVNGVCIVKVAEVLDELVYLDEITLLAIDHPVDVMVFPDFNGSIHTVKDPIKPLAAFDSDGNDCLELMERDDSYWMPQPDFEVLRDVDGDGVVDDTNESHYYKWLELEFPKPQNASMVRVVFRVKAGGFASVGVWANLIQLIGRDNLWILKSLVGDRLRDVIGDYMLTVEVWDGSGWVEAYRAFEATTSTKGNDYVIALNISGIPGDRLRLRFKSIVGMAGVDYVWVDYSKDLNVTVYEVKPFKVVGGDSSKLLADDSDYLVLRRGDEVYLYFKDPPRDSNLSRTYMIRDNGYYIFEAVDEYANVSEALRVLGESLKDRLYIIRYSIPKYYKEHYDPQNHSTIYTDYVEVEVVLRAIVGGRIEGARTLNVVNPLIATIALLSIIATTIAIRRLHRR